MSKLTEVELDNGIEIPDKYTPEELDKQYKDYCHKKRKAGRMYHKEGDTAVRGNRYKLDLPYWIHNCLIVLPEWSWVWERSDKHGPNAGTTKFRQIFPEFGDYGLGTTQDIKKQEAQVRFSHLWDNFILAKQYLEKGYKAWKTR